MTPEETNAAVARKLGHTVCTDGGHIMGKDGHAYNPPDYCRSIEAAWEIVDTIKTEHQIKLLREILVSPIDGIGWTCTIGDDLDSNEYETRIAEEIADTAPMAICQAFLKLTNVEVPV